MKPKSAIRGPFRPPLIPLISLAAVAAPSHADTIAWWRFEGEGETLPSNGAYVQDTDGRTAIQAAGVPVPDLSGNGNRLFTWNNDGTGHVHRPATSISPFSIVPQTGQPNGWFIENSGNFPASFTWSAQTNPSGVNLDTWTSLTWTIEASCYTDIVTGFRTVIGREGNDVRTGEAGFAPLYFQKVNAGNFRIAYVDAAGMMHEAVDPQLMSVGQWYHFAATCDGVTLRLYKKTGNTGSHELVASSDVSWSANPALINPGNDANGHPWGWTIGRGRYGTSDNPNENHADRWDGGIDEVRISDVALAPAQFLAATSAADTDGDGLPNTWEIQYGLDPDSAEGDDGTDGDPDNDGFSNYDEYRAGSDPTEAASVPGDIDGDGLDDAWEIAHFGNLAQTPGGDPDGDLATNLQEYGGSSDPTDPTSWPDTENEGAGDGMNDGWELFWFGHLDAAPGDDDDSDGFTNLEEHDAGTNPANPAFSPVWSVLRHRWSFNGSLADSVGGSDAVIVDEGPNNAVLGLDSVTLMGGAKGESDYVLLGNNLLQGAASPVTIELWATPNAVQNWSRIFDFHSSTGEYLVMSWTQGTNAASDRVTWVDAGVSNTVDNTNQPYALGVEHHIVMTIEPLQGPGGTTRVTWYSAPSGASELGAARGTFNTANTLVNLNDALNALGYSPWPDNVASATYNEVRIWDGALHPFVRELLHAQGPGNPVVADSDGDLLPDAWETLYELNPDSAIGDDGTLGDPDNDGASNLLEYRLGSNPASATSNPDDTDGDDLPDAWELDYFGNLLQGPDDDPDGDFATNLEEYLGFTDPTVRISAPDEDDEGFGDGMGDAWEIHYFGNTDRDGYDDFDRDGLDDYNEFVLGTDPTDPTSPGSIDGDVDGDGLDDRWEISHFGRITAQNDEGDPDEDGFSNLEEYIAGSDPNLAASTPQDVNGDGLEDVVLALDFKTAGGGILDVDGEGTGLTQRLAGTGTDPSYLPNDPNLNLDTAAGILAITSTTNDVNGQVGMDVAEMIGVPLSSLGFNGTQDFRIRAKYVDLPFGGGFDQIGVFAGSSSTSLIRGGRIAANQALGVNTDGTNDSNGNFAGSHLSLAEGRSMTVELSRTGGAWSLAVNGVNATPTAQPVFLNALSDLTVGVFALDGGSGGIHKTAKLESLTVIRFGAVSSDADGDGMDDAWEIANGLDPEVNDATDDLDDDGVDNFTEFAFNGRANDGSNRGVIVSSLADTNANGQRELLLTIAVRTGAVFGSGANGAQTATVGGITYTVRGSLDLAAFDSPVAHVGVTASGNPDYELHTFRLTASEGLTGKGFLQAGAAPLSP